MDSILDLYDIDLPVLPLSSASAGASSEPLAAEAALGVNNARKRSPSSMEQTSQTQKRGRSSVAWAEHLREAFTHGNRQRGRQTRPLRLASHCSGMGTHNRALKDSGVALLSTDLVTRVSCINMLSITCSALKEGGSRSRTLSAPCVMSPEETQLVEFEEVLGTEPKKSAQEFCLRNVNVTHLFDSISTVTANRGGKAWCAVHKTLCIVPDVSIDLLCAGFPCAPYSKARAHRYEAGRWESGVQKALANEFQSTQNSWAAHGEFGVLLNLLTDVRRSRPRSLVLENVLGLRSAVGGDRSPLDMLISELESMDYSCCALDLDLATFHPVVRQRILRQTLLQKKRKAPNGKEKRLHPISMKSQRDSTSKVSADALDVKPVICVKFLFSPVLPRIYVLAVSKEAGGSETLGRARAYAMQASEYVQREFAPVQFDDLLFRDGDPELQQGLRDILVQSLHASIIHPTACNSFLLHIYVCGEREPIRMTWWQRQQWPCLTLVMELCVSACNKFFANPTLASFRFALCQPVALDSINSGRNSKRTSRRARHKNKEYPTSMTITMTTPQAEFNNSSPSETRKQNRFDLQISKIVFPACASQLGCLAVLAAVLTVTITLLTSNRSAED
eukprot:6489631-Amphidinium_carterae.2